MSDAEWQEIYRKAFDFYYSPEHVERMFRRAKASGMKPVRLLNHVLQFYFIFKQEKVHPLQGGFFRRKIRTQRRFGLPLENPLIFYSRRVRVSRSCDKPRSQSVLNTCVSHGVGILTATLFLVAALCCGSSRQEPHV